MAFECPPVGRADFQCARSTSGVAGHAALGRVLAPVDGYRAPVHCAAVDGHRAVLDGDRAPLDGLRDTT